MSVTENTRKAYAADWRHFSRWCRMNGVDPVPPAPEVIGRYLSDLAQPAHPAAEVCVSTIERRLSGLLWWYTQQNLDVNRKDLFISNVLTAIKGNSARTPIQKEVFSLDDIHKMVATLPYDLRGLRDRAILLLGYAGGFRRSEIVGLDHGSGSPHGSSGWIDMSESSARVTLSTKSGLRVVEIPQSATKDTCPVQACAQWLHFAKIEFGPVFLRTSRDGRRVLNTRLTDKHVARLIKRTVIKSGLRAEVPEKQRLLLFSGQSLRAATTDGR